MRFWMVLAGAMALSAAVAASARAEGGFHLRNCVPDSKVYVCSFNSHDNTLSSPYEATGVHYGENHHFRCNTNRCKTFIGGDVPHRHGFTVAQAKAIGAPMIQAGRDVTIDAIKAMMVEPEYAGEELPVAEFGVLLIVAGASLPAITEGLQKDSQCQRVVRKYKHHGGDYGAKALLTGHHVFIPIAAEDGNESVAGYALARGESCPAIE
jgi:hypothetical protein